MKKTEDFDVVIVGAGASGLMAACAAAGYAYGGRRASVALLERGDRPGRKLSITGKGRCNITNNAEKEQFMLNIPGNGKFLYSAFSKMSNLDIVAYFERLGVGVALERGGRYFTKSGSAREVTDALAGEALRLGAAFRCNARAASVERAACFGGGAGAESGMSAGSGAGAGADGGACRRFVTKCDDGREFTSRAVIIATGGISYPATGSTGDGYRFAQSLGHTVVPPRPSLVPLETYETWPGDLAGLTLKNAVLKLYSKDGIKLFSKLGEMLFTHFGISGPLVLSGSRALLDYGFTGCTARVDLKPGLSDEKLRARIGRDFELYAKKRLGNAMKDLLPMRIIPVVIGAAGLNPDSRADAVGKAGAARLSEAMKGLALTIKAPRPPSEAVVTAGGVKTDEINPSAMESKLVPGLYFCGEVVDVDAYTGGFNLTIAFSTGRLAGTCAAKGVLAADKP